MIRTYYVESRGRMGTTMKTVKITKDGITFEVPLKDAMQFAESLGGTKGMNGKAPRVYVTESELQEIKATTPEELVLKAIDLSVSKGNDGIHVVYSGLNALIKSRFGKEGKAVTESLEKAGKIKISAIKGGVIVKRA